MRSQVYSWRVSPEVKSELERAARVRKTTVSAILDAAVRNWLDSDTPNVADADEQRRLHLEAARCLGTITGGDPNRAATARNRVKERILKRHGR